MTQIYLCDDEAAWLERLEKAITEYVFRTDLDLRIAFRSTSPSEFLTYFDYHLPPKVASISWILTSKVPLTV